LGGDRHFQLYTNIALRTLGVQPAFPAALMVDKPSQLNRSQTHLVQAVPLRKMPLAVEGVVRRPNLGINLGVAVVTSSVIASKAVVGWGVDPSTNNLVEFPGDEPVGCNSASADI